MQLLLPYEVWRDIKGYEGLYQISARGRVKSLNRITIRKNGAPLTIPEKVLTLWDNGHGYLRVSLYDGHSNKRYLGHRLVLESFTVIPIGEMDVNHKNGVRSDNDISNLEWCTRSDNEYHKKYTLGKCVRPVFQIDLDGHIVKKWASMSLASREGGFDMSSIRNSCTGKFKQHSGYKWSYS